VAPSRRGLAPARAVGSSGECAAQQFGLPPARRPREKHDCYNRPLQCQLFVREARMAFKYAGLVILGMILALVSARDVAAAIYDITMTESGIVGSVAVNPSYQGQFGELPQSGDPFSASLTVAFDSSNIATLSSPGFSNNYVSGNAAATIAYNGIDLTLRGDGSASSGNLININSGSIDGSRRTLDVWSGAASFELFLGRTDSTLASPLTATAAILPTDTLTGLVQFYGSASDASARAALEASIVLEGRQLSYAVAAVPEPSTWAMLLLGFAGFGLVSLRCKRQSLRLA